MNRILAAVLFTLIPAVGWAQNTQLNVSIPGSGTPTGWYLNSGTYYPIGIIANPATPTQEWLIDPSGRGPVSVADGADVTLGAKADASWSGSGSGSAIAVLKSIQAAAIAPIVNFPALLDVNTGNASTSTIRVVLASNQPAVTVAQGTGSNLHMTCDSGCAGAAAVAPLSADSASSKVLKASAGTLYSASATNYSSTGGYMIVYNATAAPSPGSLTAALVLACAPLAGSGSASVGYAAPATFSTGIVVLLSSASNCVTYTTGTITGFISGQAS